MELRKYQTDAVNSVSKFIQYNVGRTETLRRFCLLQAPTGSGKTVMVSSVIDENPNVSYLFISPGKGGLGVQTYNSLNKYSKEYKAHYADDSSVNRLLSLQAGEVLVVSWESINKSNNILVAETERRNLFDVLKNTSNEIVLIIDEAHFAKTEMSKAQRFLEEVSDILGYRPITIDVTATPSKMNSIDAQAATDGSQAHVVVHRSDVSDSGMITEFNIVNEGVQELSSLYPDLSENEVVLSLAVNKIDQIDAEVSWSPKMLVQIPKAAAGDKYQSFLLSYFSDLGYTTENGSVGIYLSDTKINVDDLNNPESPVKVILFKEGLTMGWDCPTACVLVSFRESKNNAFKSQVVGRIMRMPEQKHYDQDFLNYGYIFTSFPKDMWTGISDGFDVGYIKDAALSYTGPEFYIPGSLNVFEQINMPGKKEVRAALEDSSVSKYATEHPDIISNVNLSKFIFSDAIEIDGVIMNDTEDADVAVSDIAIEVEFNKRLAAIADPLVPSTLRSALLSWMHQNLSYTSGSFAMSAMGGFLENEGFRNAVASFVEDFSSTLETNYEAHDYEWTPPDRIAVTSKTTENVLGSSRTYTYVDQDGCPTFPKGLSEPEQKFVQKLDEIAPDAWMKNGDGGSDDFRIALDDGGHCYPDFILVIDGQPAVFEVKYDSTDIALGAGSVESRIKAKKLAEWSDRSGLKAALVYHSRKTNMMMATVSDDSSEDIPLSDLIK